MGKRYTQVPADAFQHLQINAGILVEDFKPATGVVEGILGASSGGINFSANTTYIDRGSNIDNCPKNTKELKEVDDVEAKMSGTFVTVTSESAKRLAAAADVDAEDETHIIPRRNLELEDFEDVWWVGDYSHENSKESGGYCAIHLMNALSTGGFQIQSKDKDNGTFGFEFTGHFSLSDPDQVPYEIYIKSGT